MQKKTILYFLSFLAFIIIFVSDQLSKYYILQQSELANHGIIEVTPFFNIVLTFNRGVSFGMFAGHNQPLLLIAIACVIILVLLSWLRKNTSPMVALAVGAIIGGATGNVIDRIRHGAVVDFLDFYIKGLHWPAFNIADSFVFIGVVVLCVYSMFFEKKDQL